MSTQHLLLYYYLFICFAFFLVLACGSICSMQWSGSRYLSRMLKRAKESKHMMPYMYWILDIDCSLMSYVLSKLA